MGGNAIKNALPIRARKTVEIYNKILSIFKSSIYSEYYNEMSILGSGGKKNDDDFNGDLDIAIKIESQDKLNNILLYLFPDCELNPKTFKGISSIGYKYQDKNELKIAQVDFMISNNIKWSKFRFFSPNFIKHESKYKGADRQKFISTILRNIPLYEDKTFFKDGSVKTKYKYSLLEDGIYKQFINYEGVKGKLKNPKKDKSKEIFITNNPIEAINLVFNNPNIKDFNSVESIYKCLMDNNKFKYPELRQIIINELKNELKK